MKNASFALPEGYFSMQGGSWKIDASKKVRSEDKLLATLGTSQFKHDINNSKYLADRIISNRSYEIEVSGNEDFQKIWDEIRNFSIQSIDNEVVTPSAFNSLILHDHTITYYDGVAFEGLAYGEIGNYGVPVRIEKLYMKPEEITAALGYLPPYLDPAESTTWDAIYPDGFKNPLTDINSNDKLLSYQYHDNTQSGKEHYITGYYCQTARKAYDFQLGEPKTRGLAKQMKDPRGNVGSVSFDEYDFLPIQTIDPYNSLTITEYDYRIFQSNKTIDPNDNVSQFKFSPLGFLEATYVEGKAGDQGDSLGLHPDKPSASYDYDFFNFINNFNSGIVQLAVRFPIFVKTTTRETHASDPNGNDKTIISVEYSDGFGRTVQTRTQAEEVTFGSEPTTRIIDANSGLSDDQTSANADAIGYVNTDENNLNVIVSGWNAYDNGGRIVVKTEPHYARGFNFESSIPINKGYKDGIIGEQVRIFYDPRGQVIKTIKPNGGEYRVLYGIPYSNNLNNSNSLNPTPWATTNYDANDLATLTANVDNTEETNNTSTEHHFTPSTSYIDALGRTVKTIDRNFKSGSIENIEMNYEYDIRGNLLKTTDALGRIAFDYTYDTANRTWKVEHIDGGVKTTIYNATNQPVEIHDDKGAMSLYLYDGLNRPLKVWARDNALEPITLRQEYIYGETSGLSEAEQKQKNLKGKLYQQKDECGICTYGSYDFKGNILQKTKQVFSDDTILNKLNVLDADTSKRTVDWENFTTADLDIRNFTMNMEYDGLNRVTKMTLPEDLDTERKELTTNYNRSGALDSVILDGTTYIDRISYNARGQRILMALGNGTMCRYAYDDKTFWLKRLKTEKYIKDTSIPNRIIYQPQAGTTLQDYAYEYDLAGNITKIKDRTPDSGYGANLQDLDRVFSYDAIYRLLSATGRETAHSPADPWDETFRPEDHTLARGYTRTYEYDVMGNILNQTHITSDSGGAGNFTKNFNYVANTNQLNDFSTVSSENPLAHTYQHDVNGNIIQEGTSRFMQWDIGDNLRAFYIQAGATPSIQARYLYDNSGNRAKKLVKKQNGDYTSTTYIDGVFEYTRDVSNNSATVKEQSLIHIMDGDSRIAILRQGDALGDDKPAIKYCHEDHLGNGSLYSDTNGTLINREEYYPFGETSFGSYSKKRYRFNGKEKDEESGLYYYGMRYYAPWLCRFISVDPLANKYADISSFNYAGNKPINKKDVDGLQEEGRTETEQSTSTTAGNAKISKKPPSLSTGAKSALFKIRFNEMRSGLVNEDKPGGTLKKWRFDEKVVQAKSKFKKLTGMDYSEYKKLTSKFSVRDKVTFSGFKDTETKGCFVRCKEMLDSADYVTTVGGSNPKNIQMVKYGSDGKTLENQPDISKGKETIDNHLEDGKPIIVGVDRKAGDTGNTDNTTDHWIVIVEKEVKDDGTTVYRYFDPQTSDEEHGTSTNNELTLQSDGRISGTYTTIDGDERNYTVTMVRPTSEKPNTTENIQQNATPTPTKK